MEAEAVRKAMVISPEQGRVYEMGRMRAIFKVDGEETRGQYSVSEWWLEPGTRGPGDHAHSDDHVFYVIAGTLSLHLYDEWVNVPQRGYVLIPGGTAHDFQNRGSMPAGFISFNSPGGFETKMASIASALGAADLSI